MPVDAPLAKQVATAEYGAEVVLEGETFDESYAAARADVADGRVLVPPFDDEAIIAGQGTIGLELLEQAPDADVIVVPLGGGGLLSGIAIAVKALRPAIRVIGVQAAGCAAWPPSLAAGRPLVIERGTTIADGIAVQRPGELTFPLVRELVDDVVEVTEDEICRAVVVLLERSKLMVEGAGAAGLAALLAGKVEARQAVCVLSGGNLDAGMLQVIVRFGLTRNGRFLRLRTQMPDRPGRAQAPDRSVRRAPRQHPRHRLPPRRRDRAGRERRARADLDRDARLRARRACARPDPLGRLSRRAPLSGRLHGSGQTPVMHARTALRHRARSVHDLA